MSLDLLVKDPVVSGGLALFPVFSTSPAAPHYLTGPEADAAKVVSVGELEDGATVPTLLVENHGTDAVLLVEGETLVGAQQNRTLNVSVLVGAVCEWWWHSPGAGHRPEPLVRSDRVNGVSQSLVTATSAPIMAPMLAP
jgi:hypothetical protein